MLEYSRCRGRAEIFLLLFVASAWPAMRALATDSDTFVTNVGGKVTIGGANNLEEVDENFDLTSQIFYSPMQPGFPPFEPHDFGNDDPGFFALGSDRVADFPSGTSPLPAGASVTVHIPNFTVAGNTDKLFYWDGAGAVNFQPISTTQPGVALAIGANPLGPTSSPSSGDTSFGALHQHPGFTLDNGGAGVPADGVYLNAANISVTGLTDSKTYYNVWVIDSLINDGDKVEDLRDALLTHADPPIVDGKDFSFVNHAIGYVQSNLVSVPEPTTATLISVLAFIPFLSTSRRRKSAVCSFGGRS
ncbi:MAG TPA: hypothetical protein VH107_20290 [Lacipirellulaceae bacterium]|nr:hypothetical protein [Lacipirellulaceae bacterium]